MSDVLTIGKFLQDMRKRSGKNQRQVSRELAMTPGNICRWEKDRQKIPVDKVHEVAQVYGMSEDEEHQLVSFSGEAMVLPNEALSEYKLFYALIMLPKGVRDRVIRAVRAYDSTPQKK